ncbi:hypothetical protein [Desulfosporosinus sp. BICA1-9]|uniref:hypothetical protein n=1 Tax=Desulfosporosinus sp. BICA1-9 TaxID=1531958 RepID=UPI00054C4FAE|nr:hypothetical protein [Desulfosporosinus sp. BICA1-9]KJS47185.1 MAG: hypothetical protein VR66_21005 [Peptococcaceae bacterium BRH_c23]KJS89997.1 MAG: hypothetical protein JL57_04005 [Desulfosporosinus sp. BICA1-9]HBW36404.1 hypothetical protein [Desulfosporosinus sp.]
MLEYYSYLWSTTWPNLIVLLLIWVIVLFRLGWKFLNTWRFAHDAWGFLLLAGKAIIWVGILAVYTELFSQPDWFDRPGLIQGLVQGKAYDSGSGLYIIDLGNGSENNQFYVDRNVYDKVNLEDQVKLMYLPSRREVIRCEFTDSLL